MTFETLEDMVRFQEENKEVYEITFQIDCAHLYKRGEGVPLATVYDKRAGIIASMLLEQTMKNILAGVTR